MRRMNRNLAVIGSVCIGLSLQGCLATRGWVTNQMAPLSDRVASVEGQVSGLETQVSETNVRIDHVVDRFDQLRLERRFVLSLENGAQFAPNSTALSDATQHEVTGFLSDVEGVDEAIFLVAGHTDATGSEAYNYALGQRRADSVAQFLTAQAGINPLQVTTVSYGESKPVAANDTREGRQRNRRVEILVYKQALTTQTQTTAAHAVPPQAVAY